MTEGWERGRERYRCDRRQDVLLLIRSDTPSPNVSTPQSPAAARRINVRCRALDLTEVSPGHFDSLGKGGREVGAPKKHSTARPPRSGSFRGNKLPLLSLAGRAMLSLAKARIVITPHTKRTPRKWPLPGDKLRLLSLAGCAILALAKARILCTPTPNEPPGSGSFRGVLFRSGSGRERYRQAVPSSSPSSHLQM